VPGLEADVGATAERGEPVGHPLQAGAVPGGGGVEPAPSSATVKWRVPPEQDRPTVARDPPARVLCVIWPCSTCGATYLNAASSGCSSRWGHRVNMWSGRLPVEPGRPGFGRADQWCCVLSGCLPWGAEDQVELAELQGQR